jgi:SAM-dependent methyltransferase
MKIIEIKSCPCCNNKNTNEILKIDSNKKIESFKIYSKKYYNGFLDNYNISKIIISQCLICKHLFYKYQPDKNFLIRMYDEHAKNKVKKKNLEKMFKFKMILGHINKIKKINKVLDYGSGYGEFKEICEKNNFQYYGFEPSKKRNKKNVYSKLEYIKKLKIKFDLIFLNQVLEHLPDPSANLKEIKTLCHKNTMIYVSVPNFNRPKEKNNFYSSWPYDEKYGHHTLAPFQHLHCYNTMSLLKLMDYSGYEIKKDFKTFFYNNINLLRIFIGIYLKRLSTTDILFKKK